MGAAASEERLAVELLIDGKPSGMLPAPAPGEPRFLMDLMPERRRLLKRFVRIDAVSLDGATQELVDVDVGVAVGGTPVLYRDGGVVGFGLLQPNGTILRRVASLGTIALHRDPSHLQHRRYLEFADGRRLPFEVEDFDRFAPGHDTKHGLAAEDDAASGQPRANAGKGPGPVAAKGRNGVTLQQFLAALASTVSPRSVVLRGVPGDVVVESAVLSDPTVELRMKFNSREQLCFRRYDNAGGKGELVAEVRDVTSIALR